MGDLSEVTKSLYWRLAEQNISNTSKTMRRSHYGLCRKESHKSIEKRDEGKLETTHEKQVFRKR